MTRIAHISDIHFGRIAYANDAQIDIVQALIDDINAASVDLVVVSGDLTQRAFGHQFRAARRMLDAFYAPTLVVPGNHDVFPWWRLLSRLFDPLRRYRKLISPDLNPRVELKDAVVVGINSAHGWTVQGGRITASELDQIRHGFEGTASGTARILVVHHHITKLTGLGDHDMVKGAEQARALVCEANVGLILSGHLHIDHVEMIEAEGNRYIVASCGTSTSSRGRGKEGSVNLYNLISIEGSAVDIETKRFNSAEQLYATQSQQSFVR